MSEREIFAPSQTGVRRFGWRMRAMLGLALVIITFVGASIVYLLWTADGMLKDAFVEAEQDEPSGWHIMDLEGQRRSVPDEQNMGNVVLRVKTLMPPNWPFWSMPGNTTQNTKLSEEQQQTLDMSFTELKPQHQLDETQINALRQEIQRADPAIREALKVLQMSHGRFSIAYGPGINILGTPLQNTQDTREIARLLGEVASMRAQDGDADGALTACRAILISQRAVGDEPLYISTLVRVAVRSIARSSLERTLAQGQPSDAALAQMQQLIDEELKENLLLTGARGERAVSDEVLEDLQRSPLKMRQMIALVGTGGPGPSLITLESLRMLLPGSIKMNRAAMLRFNNRVVAIARKPVEQQMEDFQALDASSAELPVLSRLISPAVIKVAKASWRDIAQMLCAKVMLAAERYRRAEGHWPKGIADLVPKYLVAVPPDPFDGKPLRMRRFEEGLVIYSIGENRVDDGGDVDFPQTKGYPVVRGPLDLGYRLWDIDRRRQSPAAVEKKGEVLNASPGLPGGVQLHLDSSPKASKKPDPKRP